jgi:hypothetical protein
LPYLFNNLIINNFPIDDETFIELIPIDFEKQHPDTVMASKIIDNNSLNKYIGVSFLCCIFCSIYLESCGFRFRGRCKRFYRDWGIPANTNDDFTKNLDLFRKNIEKQENGTVEFSDRDRGECIDHFCPQIYELYSDDICQFYDFLYLKFKSGRSYLTRIYENFPQLI